DEKPRLIVTLDHTAGAGGINGLAFSPDSKTLASAGADGAVRLWHTSLKAGKEMTKSTFTFKTEPSQPASVSFSPDGKRLAAGSWNLKVQLWDTTTGLEVQALRGHTGGINTVAFSPDGQRLASGGMDGLVKLWETDAAQEYFDGPAGAFSPDGNLRASASPYDGIRVRETATGR